MRRLDPTNPEIVKLSELLRERLRVIGDTAFRDRDPDGHLARLKAVSEEIFALQAEMDGRIPVRLDHFLKSCSYQKALDLIDG